MCAHFVRDHVNWLFLVVTTVIVYELPPVNANPCEDPPEYVGRYDAKAAGQLPVRGEAFLIQITIPITAFGAIEVVFQPPVPVPDVYWFPLLSFA